MRPLLTILLYVLIGTATTLVIYRIGLGGPLAAGGAERSLDGLVIFLSIAMNTALAFGAAAVASVMVAQSKASLGLLAAISAGIAGVIAAGMAFWFTGLSYLFPAVAAVCGAFCAFIATRLGLFRVQG